MILSISNASRKERDILFREVSLKNNINQVIIEKDFWVCFILDHLFNFSTYKEKLFFKGGTSLSKCYNIIKRFSEDVDLVIDPSLVGIQETVMWEDRSNNSQHKFNEFINEKTNYFLLEEFIPTLKNELNLRGYNDFNLVMD